MQYSALNISLNPRSITVIDNNRLNRKLNVLTRFLKSSTHKVTFVFSDSTKLPKNINPAIHVPLNTKNLYSLLNLDAKYSGNLIVIADYDIFTKVLNITSKDYVYHFLQQIVTVNDCAVLIINTSYDSQDTIPFKNQCLFNLTTYIRFS